MKIFNLESPFMQWMNKATDFLILNLLFLLACLPVFTIGPAISALYTVTFKKLAKEDLPIVKSFWQAFKVNFKMGTLSWLTFLLLFGVVNLDFNLIQQGTIFGKPIFLVLLLLVDVLLLIGLLYCFPYIAKFENSLKKTLVNAIVMGIAHFPSTLLLVLLLGIFLFVLGYFSLLGRIFIFFFGFSGLAYFSGKIFNKIFSRYCS